MLGKQTLNYSPVLASTTPPAELSSLANENMVRREHGLTQRGAYYPSKIAIKESKK